MGENQNETTAKALSEVLASSYSLMLKAQNFHWNVMGKDFAGLHALFQQNYDDLWIAVDLIAERIRMLGYYAPGSFTEFRQLSVVPCSEHPKMADEMINELLEDHLAVASLLKAAIYHCLSINDEVTNDLLTGRLGVHDKMIWFLSSMTESPVKVPEDSSTEKPVESTPAEPLASLTPGYAEPTAEQTTEEVAKPINE